jgi:hypothetical protein
MKIDPRIHACLDGECSREILSAAEQAELQALEADLLAVIQCARAVPSVDLRTAVLGRLPLESPSLPLLLRAKRMVAQSWAWFVAPHRVAVQVRPAFALALVSLIALGVSQKGAGTEPLAADAQSVPVLVQFRLDASHALSVALAGSFSEWTPAIELRESAPGVWTAVVPLTPGVHDYLFLVDGDEWRADPTARSVADDFGGTHSRLLLTPPVASL